MNLAMLTEAEALDLAGAPAFRAEWLALHARCPWATACQHPDFVLPWYRLYGDTFLPVLVLARSAGGELRGLFALAREKGGAIFTGAGERQAEYHAWLADPADGDAFIRASMTQLRAECRGADLRLRYLPPGIPLEWAVGIGVGQCVLRAYRRPVMHLDAAAMARQRNKKNNRQNYNRLGRIGELAFEQVRDEAQFTRVFEDICLQYDFRQGALHRQTPFRSDPRKKLFFLELHRRGLLHTTILTVGGELAASHVGLLSRGRALHLGINTHAPSLAAHSPGNLLLAMLGVHLAQEGLPVFDLTPGGDEYKEHFATGHDLVFELVMYGDARRRLQAEMRAGAARWVKAGLRAAGYRSADVLAAADTLKRACRTGIRSALGQLRAPQRQTSVALSCRLGAAIRWSKNTEVRKNRVADALRYDAGAAPLGYWQFLHHAMQRMERSHDLYSMVQDGKLLVFGWLAESGAAMLPLELQRPAGQPNGAALLFDLYVHPELGRGECLRSFVEQVMAELQREGREGFLCCTGELRPEFRQALVDSGFTDASGQDDVPGAFETQGLRETRS